MGKYERCLVKVRTQKRNPGFKHWALAAKSICRRTCKKCRRKK